VLFIDGCKVADLQEEIARLTGTSRLKYPRSCLGDESRPDSSERWKSTLSVIHFFDGFSSIFCVVSENDYIETLSILQKVVLAK